MKGRERVKHKERGERETANPKKVLHLFEAALNSSVTLQILLTENTMTTERTLDSYFAALHVYMNIFDTVITVRIQ